MQFIRLIWAILNDIRKDVKKDFEPSLHYEPYNPKVLGNRLKGDK